jgi:hypothetical protein
MAGDATQLVVAGTGVINLAPYGTALPDDATAVFDTLDAAYVDLGYTTEDGATIIDGVSVEDVKAWQTPYPVRRLVTDYTGTVSFELLQWSKDIWEQVIHGVVTEPVADTVHRFTPTRDGVVAEKSLVLDFEDGAFDYRYVVPKCGLSGDVEIPISRTAVAKLPTEWGVIGGDAAGAWYLLTNDPNFSID